MADRCKAGLATAVIGSPSGATAAHWRTSPLAIGKARFVVHALYPHPPQRSGRAAREEHSCPRGHPAKRWNPAGGGVQNAMRLGNEGPGRPPPSASPLQPRLVGDLLSAHAEPLRCQQLELFIRADSK